MDNILLISHGKMADGVKSSVEMIVGKQSNLYTVSLTEEGDDRQFENDLQATMKTLQGTALIIADLLGGTPCNVALKNYMEDSSVSILAGMSLPIVIEAVVNPEITIKELLKIASQATIDVKSAMTQAKEDHKKDVIASDSSGYKEYAGKANLVNVRIDERLIHGQVAGIWSTSLDTQRIIVVNDEAASDPMQKASLRMAAPSSMRLSVLPVEEAAININSGKYGKQRLFLLFKNPTDVLRFIEAGGTLSMVNVGNMSYKDGAREVTKSIQVLPEEEVVFQRISEKGVRITAQLVPNDPIVEFMEKLKKK